MPLVQNRGRLRLVGGTEIDRHERSSVIEAHLDWCRWSNLRPGTITQRRYALNRLARFHPDVELLDITHEHVAAFRDRLTRAGQPLAPNSQSMELKHFRGFFTWAVLEGLIDQDPMLRVPMPRLPKKLPHPIPEHELALALATARERIRPWFLLAAFAGLRASEIAALRADDIWWHTTPALIVVREGKGGGEGTVPMSPIIADALAPLPKRGWLFPKLDGSLGPVKGWTVSHLCNDHLHRIGSTHTIHACRHRFGTLIHRLSGGDLRVTQELMRHKSILSTTLYTEVDQAQAAGVVAALPTVEGYRAAS